MKRCTSLFIITGLSLLFVSSCNVESARFDLQDYDINFNRNDALYTNSDTYKVDWRTFGKLRADQSLTQFEAWHKLEIFKNGDCTGEPDRLVNITNVSETNYMIDPADNQTVYSVRVRYGNSVGKEIEKCSFPIVIDRDKPNLIAFDYPAVDHYIGQKSFLLKFQEGSDVGISGLTSKPYKVMLYSQPQCQGSLVETVETNSTEVEFKNLINGNFYSVGIVVTDKSGNSTEISCSKHIEIDTNVPTLAISDPSSAIGFTRISNPVLTLGNDSTASYWCVTEDIYFVPTSISDACPGGQGSSNGWFTSRPATINLSSGNGAKKFKAWIARSDGNMSSGRYAYAETIFDSVPPGSFAPVGISGGDSPIYDEWLNSLTDPIFKWQPSTEAVDYTIVVNDSSNQEICRYEAVPGDETQITLDPEACIFVEDETYTIDIIAYDRARNPTVGAPDFSFTVDLTPPTVFAITGVDGGADVKVDSWFGTTLPKIHYSNPEGEDFFNISIRDAASGLLCSAEIEPINVLTHDYSASDAAICSAPVSGDSYTLHVSAEDYANNVTPATNIGFAVRADLDAPEAVVTSGPDALTPNTSAQIDFSVNDPLSGIDSILCRLNGSSWEACASSKEFLNLTQNNYLFEVQATDNVGNITFINHEWDVDTEDPVLTITSQPQAYSNQLTSSVGFNATDTYGIDNYECSLNGADWSNCSSPWSQLLTDGLYTFQVKATDNVGHTSTTESASWRIDTVAPNLTITSAPSSITYDASTAQIHFTASDDQALANTQCSFNDGAFTNCSSPYSRSGLSGDTYSVTVRAIDNAGNATTQSTSWTNYTHTWQASGWGACSATQPSWQVGGWGGCTAAQPAWQYGGWGGCSASCGGGVRYRAQSCPVVYGAQYRSVSCPTNSGTQSRSVYCQRNDGNTVADSFCSGAGAKPTNIIACSRNDCAGAAPAGSQSCTRGGGGDCHSAQATSQSCNTQSCSPSTCSAMVADRICTQGGANIFNMEGISAAACRAQCESRAGVRCCVHWAGYSNSCWGYGAPASPTGATQSLHSAASCN